MKRLFHCFLIGILQVNAACGQPETANIEIDFSAPETISSYRPGVTHTQRSIDPWGNPAAIERAKALLDSASYFQNQHIMGWGAESPWPDSTIVDPDNWNWQSLDTRMNLIRETKGIPVITLCGVPSWMHTPTSNGETDWSALEKAPTRSHFDDFAHLCAEVARRYPDVLHFQVWNEMKGFYHPGENRWNYEEYTAMYNIIYDSLKAVNRQLNLGGPYVVMDSWSAGSVSHPSNITGGYGVIDQRSLDVITYWLNNKKGSEFIAIDGGSNNKDGVWTTDHFKASDKFVDIINWIRKQPGGETLPVWWSEWYAYPVSAEPHGDASHEDPKLLNAVMAVGLIKSVKAGYSNIMIWQPQGDLSGYSFPLGIWSTTESADGGQETFFYHTQKVLKAYFSEGAKIFKTKVSLPDAVSVFATDSLILVVNQLDKELRVRIKGTSDEITLSPFEVYAWKDFQYPDGVITSAIRTEVGNAISIYPNPFSNEITIGTARRLTGRLKLEIYDLTGRRMLAETIEDGGHGTAPPSVNLRTLSQGVYIARISGTEVYFQELLVKE